MLASLLVRGCISCLVCAAPGTGVVYGGNCLGLGLRHGFVGLGTTGDIRWHAGAFNIQSEVAEFSHLASSFDIAHDLDHAYKVAPKKVRTFCNALRLVISSQLEDKSCRAGHSVHLATKHSCTTTKPSHPPSFFENMALPVPSARLFR